MYTSQFQAASSTPSGIIFLHRTVTSIETDIPPSKVRYNCWASILAAHAFDLIDILRELQYGKRNCFLLHTTKASEPITHYLAAPSEDAKKEWIEKIIWAINFDDPNHSDAEKEPDRGPPVMDISWKNKLLSKVRWDSRLCAIIQTFFGSLLSDRFLASDWIGGDIRGRKDNN